MGFENVFPNAEQLERLIGVLGSVTVVGPQGPAYTLTEQDKQTIVQAVVEALPVYSGEVESVG